MSLYVMLALHKSPITIYNKKTNPLVQLSNCNGFSPVINTTMLSDLEAGVVIIDI